jgi:hypothetical protein
MTRDHFEAHRPLSKERAREIIAAQPGNHYSSVMTPAEYATCRSFLFDHCPGSWNFNSVVRACAKDEDKQL